MTTPTACVAEAAAPATYTFRHVTPADLPMLAAWLCEPHVIEWWGNPDEELALIAGDLDHPAMSCFIVETGGTPFAYVQSWDSRAVGGFEDQPAGSRGVDAFIGRPDMVGRGHGAALLRAFTDRLLADGAPRVLIDPDPANARAIRAYARAGFRPLGEVMAPDGPVLLMARDADTNGSLLR